MDTMPVSRERIKALRDARAWSQAHLAEAAGLSLRTVQRVEAEGMASAETRLALAATFDVPVESLNEPAPAATPAATAATEPEPDQVPGAARVGVFAAGAAGLLFALWLGSGLPPRVASHFDVTGAPNGWMSRDGFVGSMVVSLTVLPVLLQAGVALALRFDKVNIPNARYWLAPPQRAAAVRSLHLHFAWFLAGMTAFLAWVFWRVAAANRAPAAAPEMDSHAMLAGLAVVLVGTTAWIAVVGRRFRR